VCVCVCVCVCATKTYKIFLEEQMIRKKALPSLRSDFPFLGIIKLFDNFKVTQAFYIQSMNRINLCVIVVELVYTISAFCSCSLQMTIHVTTQQIFIL
jgi:hypothetical protein